MKNKITLGHDFACYVYDIVSLTTISGRIYWFAIEIEIMPFYVNVIGIGCTNKYNAQIILDSYLDE
jgi:hypothetical protein